MNPPTAGECRTRGTLQRLAAPTRDAYGEAVESWTDVATVWARLAPLSGREAWQAKQVQSEVTHSLWVRYSSEVAALTSAWRFVAGDGRVIQFDSAVRRDENRLAWWEILAMESPDQESGLVGSAITAGADGDELLTGDGDGELQYGN